MFRAAIAVMTEIDRSKIDAIAFFPKMIDTESLALQCIGEEPVPAAERILHRQRLWITFRIIRDKVRVEPFNVIVDIRQLAFSSEQGHVRIPLIRTVQHRNRLRTVGENITVTAARRCTGLHNQMVNPVELKTDIKTADVDRIISELWPFHRLNQGRS